MARATHTAKLGLDRGKIDACRQAASEIADRTDRFVRQRTTVAIERTVARAFGIDGADADGTPLPNLVVGQLVDAGELADGIARRIANATLQRSCSAQDVAEAVAGGAIDITELPWAPAPEVDAQAETLARRGVDRIEAQRAAREELQIEALEPEPPLHYVIVATGNIYEDAVQGRTAARQGADVVAVIRSTGQSLLDYVPFGPTIEGFGGTYATQANFRIMRDALDEIGRVTGRYVMLCNYCSGLCMPEIAVMGAFERLDMMLNDALYGILFRDINMQRTLVDQYFSRLINALAGIVINTGEDNYLTTDDAEDATHTVLASQFINEQLGVRCGLRPEQLGLGHAMEMNPDRENGLLYELAQAQLVREVFPEHRLKFMPPTRYMTGNVFKGLVQDTLFNLVGVWTRQEIQLLGMHTEAMHTPHIADRHVALENARYVMSNARDLADEIEFRSDGIISGRARATLDATLKLLEHVLEIGFFDALSHGVFAAVRRTRDGGRGLDGVATRSERYFNPVEDRIRERLALDGAAQ